MRNSIKKTGRNDYLPTSWKTNDQVAAEKADRLDQAVEKILNQDLDLELKTDGGQS